MTSRLKATYSTTRLQLRPRLGSGVGFTVICCDSFLWYVTQTDYEIGFANKVRQVNPKLLALKLQSYMGSQIPYFYALSE